MDMSVAGAAGASLADAGRLLLPLLEQGHPIDTATVRDAMSSAFHGSDSAGVWNWKTAYDATEAAAVLFLRRFGPPHTGVIASATYRSLDGGPRLARSVQRFRNAHGRAIHPTEKPVPLLDLLVRVICPPDGLIGDWFAGSGAAGVACRLAGRRYVGSEIDPAMAQRACDRLAAILPFPVGEPS